jgi:hypothetical protein
VDSLPYVCAVQRKPYLSYEVRRARAAKSLNKALAAGESFRNPRIGVGEWNLRPTVVRSQAAKRAEHPVIGGRCAEVVLPRIARTLRARGEFGEAGELERDAERGDYVEAVNNERRWNQRRDRQEGGICSRRRRRGW